MARNDGSAYDAACREAWQIRKGVYESLEEAIKGGEVTTPEELSERLHEEIENALIYTSDQWVCAYGLRQSRDPFSEGLLDSPESIEQVIGVQAFLNLEDEIDLSDFVTDCHGCGDKCLTGRNSHDGESYCDGCEASPAETEGA